MKATFTLSLFAICLCFNAAKAQQRESVALSLGVDALFPLAIENAQYYSAKDYFNNGVGINIKAELPVSNKLYATLNSGFAYYSAQPRYYDVVIALSSYISPLPANYNALAFKYVPAKAGLRYYMVKYFYAEGEAGAAIKLNNASRNSFIYSGGIGGILPLGAHSGIEIGARYESGYKINDSFYTAPMHQLAFKAAYRYQF